MTYEELSVFGRLRKVDKCGPYSMFTKLVHEWGSFLSPLQASSLHSCIDKIHADANRRLRRRSSISSLSMLAIDTR
jgi:hypothetical protein